MDTANENVTYRREMNNFSYIHNVGKEPLQCLTIGKLIEQSAEKYGDQIAVVSVYDKRKITFSEILRDVDRLAAGLLNLGLKSDDKIGLWAPNIIEWIITMGAAARAGLIMATLNPAYEEPELKYSINKIGIKALVCYDKCKDLDFYKVLSKVCPEVVTSPPGDLQSNAVPTLKFVITIKDSTLRGAYSYDEIFNMADNVTINRIQQLQDKIEMDSPLNIQYSSGTTGKPKAACLSHFQLVNNSYELSKRLEINLSSHRILVQVPLFHIYGIVAAILPSFHFGCTLVLPTPMYNSSANLKALESENCTMIYGTPTMFVDLISLQIKEKRKINAVFALTSGGSCSQRLLREIKTTLKLQKIKSIYGSTEGGGAIFLSLPERENEEIESNSVGYVADHLEVKVVDENNNIVPFETPGELCIRGYCTMLSYYGDEEKTKEVLNSDRWLKTGDQFVLLKNGCGRIVGRLKDMIVRGGENIFPKEIEDLLSTHPSILENYVIGIQNHRLGEEVCACVRLKKGMNFDHNDLIKFCQGKLARYKIPTQLRIVNDFPKTNSGKILKSLLKEEIVKGRC